ncbi:MAG: hypothetical protein ACHWZW_04780 [Spirulina sp.]
MLTFATDRDYALAHHLMQPCLIRIIDNLRKATETLDWQSEYTQTLAWIEGTTDDQKQRVADLSAQLGEAKADAEATAQIEQALAQLPTPTPIYHLRLTQGERIATLDVWELCFRLCCEDYDPAQPATTDASLVMEDGEIDWIALDEKAKALVNQALAEAVAPAQG